MSPLLSIWTILFDPICSAFGPKQTYPSKRNTVGTRKNESSLWETREMSTRLRTLNLIEVWGPRTTLSYSMALKEVPRSWSSSNESNGQRHSKEFSSVNRKKLYLIGLNRWLKGKKKKKRRGKRSISFEYLSLMTITKLTINIYL